MEIDNRQKWGFRMINQKLPGIWFGGDYNPDQWPEELWNDDVRQMKLQRVNVVTLPVFSWARLQPSEDTYDFTWLDRIIRKLSENDISIIMATPTAAQPAWLSNKYPEILPVNINGMKRKHGARNNFCPNSLEYRKASRNISEKMAERYKDEKALVLWHINNEYGTYCYCDNCAKEFRCWLQKKYGSLEALNSKWNTNFWGHTYYNWNEIETPTYLSELVPNGLGDRDASFLQCLTMDYNRFMSDSILNCYKNEAEVIRKHTPNVPVTTNIMAPYKTLNLYTWADDLDVLAWDCYPSNNEIVSNNLMSILAMKFDLMRSVKKGQPFMLMEQTPSQQNWLEYNSQKRPGVMRLWSYQAIAHGAESCLFFQWRQSKSGFEKYHAAMVSHVGHENTRVSRELTQLGKELALLGDKILDSRIEARVAIMFDWPNWWGVEYSSGPSIALKYQEQVEKYYRAFYNMNIPVDIISQQDDLLKYDIVVAPVLYMVNEGTTEKIESFVEMGKIFITTYFSGIVDENDMVILGGYPGAFRKLLGIWVEETDALLPDMYNEMVVNDKYSKLQGTYACRLICDVVHSEGAEVIASYGRDYYKGYPCITENKFGNGKAVYIASEPDEGLLEKLVLNYCEQFDIKAYVNVPKDVEVIQRSKDNRLFTFILNYGDETAKIELPEGAFYKDLLKDVSVKEFVEVRSKDICILEN